MTEIQIKEPITDFVVFTDSTNSSENIYTMMNPIGPGGNRPNVRSSSCLNTPVLCFSTAKPAILLGFFSFFINISQFPMGPGPDGPMGGMGGMEQHHMNGSLGESSETLSSQHGHGQAFSHSHTTS